MGKEAGKSHKSPPLYSSEYMHTNNIQQQQKIVDYQKKM
jgi:hypothetical protein